MLNALTIGQLAKRTGVNIETLRFYEREKLIASPPRRASGYRQYSSEMIGEILFIRQAKELGFSLKEIGELLLLRSNSSGKASDVRRLAVGKIADIDSKITALQLLRNDLTRLTTACSGRGSIQECPIMNALESRT